MHKRLLYQMLRCEMLCRRHWDETIHTMIIKGEKKTFSGWENEFSSIVLSDVSVAIVEFANRMPSAGRPSNSMRIAITSLPKFTACNRKYIKTCSARSSGKLPALRSECHPRNLGFDKKRTTGRAKTLTFKTRKSPFIWLSCRRRADTTGVGPPSPTTEKGRRRAPLECLKSCCTQ